MTTPNYFFLKRLAERVGLVALDIGARGGVCPDLRLVAESTDFFCLEPDREECDRLARQALPIGCRSVRYIPWAAAGENTTFDLNLYRQRGCSSKFEANAELGGLFSRADYYVLEDRVQVQARPLDEILREYQVASPAFMKIDVQGMEVECFRGAHQALSNDLVGIRTEVSFFPIYKEQPLFAEVDQVLRRYNFVPMRWLEFHEWRRSTRTKPPDLANGSMPYSRGQMVHADVLYLLHPESLSAETDAGIERVIRLGLVACCYDQFDHARAAFARPRVREFCQTVASVDPIRGIEILSQAKARKFRGIGGLLHKVVKRMI